jgi:hypothetical protein
MKWVLAALILSMSWFVLPVSAQIPVNWSTQSFAWNAVAGAERYWIGCGPGTGNNWAHLKEILVPATTVRVNQVTPATGQFWCVATAENSSGESAPSNEIHILVGAPAAPTNLRVIP